MRARTVLVLTVVVAILAAFIWFFERDLPSSEERAERSRKVLPVDGDEVSALVVAWGGETVRLERAVPDGDGEDGGEEGAAAPPPPGEWRITEPLQARAERSTVESLLTTLTGLDKERTIDDADRTEVGLAEPRGRVTLVTGDGERTLEIGADVPASENVLVALEGGDEVWVTRRSFLSQLQREPGEWRSRDVFSVSRDDVERVRLSSDGEAVVVLARRDERFYVEEPVRDLAAADAVDQLLSDLVTLRAQRFLDSPGEEPPSPSELGLDPARAVVVAELSEGGEPLRVELGAPVGDPEAPGGAVYARAGGQLFEAVTDLDEAAVRPVQEWRSRSWTELRSYDVDRVEVEERGGAGPLTLVRDGVDWRRGDDAISYTAASDFLYALTDVEGELAGDGEPPALGAPILRATLASDEGDGETLTLYPPAEGGTHVARSSARDTLLLLSDEAVAEVRRALAEVRAAEPQAGDAAAGEGSDDAGE